MPLGSRKSAFTAALVLLVGFVSVVLQARAFIQARASLLQKVHDGVQVATRAAAADLDREDRECMDLVRALVADLEAGRLTLAGASHRLARETAAHPYVLGLVVVFPGPGGSLVVPANIRSANGRVAVRLEKVVDVRHTDWYAVLAAHPEPGWYGPVRGSYSGHFLTMYCEPWSPPGRPHARGHVCVSLSLHDVEALRQSLPAGRFGYTWVLSREARSLSHPKVDWVRAAKTPEQLADETGDPRLRELADRVVAGVGGTSYAIDPLTGGRAVMIQQPVPASGSSLVAVILQDYVLATEPSLRRRQIEILVWGLATLAAASALWSWGGWR